MKRQTIMVAVAVAVLFAIQGAGSSARARSESSVLDLSVEQLLRVKVTSPSKRAQPLDDVPAAVFVLTAEDIKRSGVGSIPDALRLVPGMQVARIDANKWAVSCRGFNDRFANKMLVMVDGRTVYAELFAGVFWESLDVLLEDVERIEVIRGPGASVWGANAVNGVVNIITRNARDTASGYAEAGAASSERRQVAWRQGGGLGERGKFRVYGKYLGNGAYESAAGQTLPDSWRHYRAGFRYDRAGSPGENFLLTGEMFTGQIGNGILTPTLQPPYIVQVNTQDPTSGRNLIARWSKRSGSASELTVQAFYTQLHQNYRKVLDINMDDIDLEVTRSMEIGSRHSIMTGLGYRLGVVHTTGSFQVSLDPSSSTANLLNSFVQYDFRGADGRYHVLVGTKVEHKNTSGWDVQPTARALFHASAHHALWVSSSRAVRTPSRAEQSALFHAAVVPPDARQPGAPSTVVTSHCDAGVRAEDLVALEAGYRGSFRSRFQVDVAAFDNSYKHLRSGSFGQPYLDEIDGTPYVIMPIKTGNDLEARTRGVEVSGVLQAARWCRLGMSYTYLHMRLQAAAGTTVDASTSSAGNDPSHQASAHAFVDVNPRLQVNAAVRYVGDLPQPAISSYLVGDAGASVKWSSHVSTVLGVRDIGSGNHREFEPIYIRSISAAIPTSIYAYLDLRY
jgi:iron complex outermembrane recepter protein